MNSNNLFAAGDLTNLTKIDSTLNTIQAAPLKEQQRSSFESMLEERIDYSQKPESNQQQSQNTAKLTEKPREKFEQKKTEEPKIQDKPIEEKVEKEVVSEKPVEKKVESNSKEGRKEDDTAKISKTDQKEKSLDKKDSELNQSEKIVSSSVSNGEAILKLKADQGKTAVANSMNEVETQGLAVAKQNTQKNDPRQTIENKLIKYTDSKGKTRTLRLNYQNTDIEKLAQQTQKAASKKQELSQVQSLNSENTKVVNKSEDNALELRKVADEDSLLKAVKQANQDKTLIQKATTQEETRQAKKEELSLNDLFSRNRVKGASAETTKEVNQSGELKDFTEISKLESLFTKSDKPQMLNNLQAQVPFETAMNRIRQASGPQIRQVEVRQQVLNQFLDAAKAHLSKDQSQMTVKLKPDYLGEINIKIQVQNSSSAKSSVMVGQIEVENNTVKDILHSNISQLKSQLESQNGLSVKKFEIVVKQELPDQYQQPEQQQQQQQYSHQSKKPIHFMNFGYDNDEETYGNDMLSSEVNWPGNMQTRDYLIQNGYSWVA